MGFQVQKSSALTLAAIVLVIGCLLQRPVQAQSDSDTLQIVISAEHIEDTWLNNAPGCRELNNGAHGGAIAGFPPSEGSVFLIRLLDLSEILGNRKIISSCSLFVYVSSADGISGDKVVGVKRVLKPWIAGTLDYGDPGDGEGCTFNDWSADSLEWGLPGCHLEDDLGEDNTGDGEGADCKQTPLDTVTVRQTPAYPWVEPGYRAWEINPELVQGWYDGTIENNGLAMKVVAPWGWVHVWQTDYWVEGMRPYFKIAYASSVSITLTPVTTPIVVPAGGGTVEFILESTNTASNSCTADIWGLIEDISQGRTYEIHTHSLSIPPAGSVQFPVGVNVPASAPAGFYLLTAFIGDYPDVVDDSDVIDFQKASGVDGRGGGSEPEAGAFPNPFNPSTVIHLNLPADGFVNLSIYDLHGCLVTELLDGYRRKGAYEIPFDGTGLPSGIYYYRLKTDTYVKTGKLSLVK